MTATAELEDETQRIWWRAGLATYLPESRRIQLLTEILPATHTIADPFTFARVLTFLAPYLSEVEQSRVLNEALTAACTIEDKDNRASALTNLAGRLVDLDPALYYPTWRSCLSTLSQRTRSELLTDLIALAPIIDSLGDLNACAAMGQAILDTARWWP